MAITYPYIYLPTSLKYEHISFIKRTNMAIDATNIISENISLSV